MFCQSSRNVIAEAKLIDESFLSFARLDYAYLKNLVSSIWELFDKLIQWSNIFKQCFPSILFAVSFKYSLNFSISWSSRCSIAF